jgi:hypothetical protein
MSRHQPPAGREDRDVTTNFGVIAKGHDKTTPSKSLFRLDCRVSRVEYIEASSRITVAPPPEYFAAIPIDPLEGR